MLAEKTPEFRELTKEIYKQNADETIRDQCLVILRMELSHYVLTKRLSKMNADASITHFDNLFSLEP